MSKEEVEIHYLRPDELGPYVEGLRALEEAIEYPVGDGADYFSIDHGEDYHRFFSEMGDAHFLVATEGGEVVGSIAGVFKRMRRGEEEFCAAYLGDMKVAERWRGGRLGPRILRRCLTQMLKTRELRRWDVAFGAGMRGARGDFTRMAAGKPFHVARLVRPVAELALYFEPPESLAGLVGDVEEIAGPAGVDFSWGATDGPDDWTTTVGKKDLRLKSTGKPWPLVHLVRGPAGWKRGFGAYLRRCGDEILDHGEPGSLACFGLDRRMTGHLGFLEEQGLRAGATCTVYGLAKPGVMGNAPWVHLATSEI